jgi:hypothetical protein
MKFKGVFLAAILTAVLCISGNLLAYSGGTGEPNVKLVIFENSSLSTVNISGYVKTAQGVRIKGANVSASTGQTTVSDALGYYVLVLPSPFTGSITASQTDWTFDSLLYSNQSSDLANQNLTGTYTVSYGGGSGTSSSPYLIYNAAQLNAIGAKAGDWGKYFRLMANIDLSGYDGQAGRPSFNRIGYYYINFVGNAAFTGVFDGRGYTISNFTFNSDAGNDGVGIFGYINSSTAAIKNVKLSNVNVSSTSDLSTGALIGSMDGGTLTNCSVQGGTVSGVYAVGGLVGTIWGFFYGATISDCNAAVNVSGDQWVGGLFGSNLYDSLTISDCNASCIVNGGQACGGLAGGNVGTMSKCSSSGNVTVTGRSAGGLAGKNSGIIQYCFSTANVTGMAIDEIGGLVGRNDEIISDCYATGTVNGYYPTGGLVGINIKAPETTSGSITNCYSTGISNGGGLIGRNLYGVVTNSFWNTQTSGQTWSDGGTGKTTAQMQTEATFVGWDFVIETANGSESIWYIKPNNYPQLCWEAGIKYGGGDGSMTDPFLIYTAEQMNKIGTDSNDWKKSFKLMADISLAAYSGSAYNIIGTGSSKSFTGTFDGNYHSISGFSCSRSSISYVGLFGYVANNGTIKNLKVISPSLTDAGFNDMTYVGSIAGYANGSNISECSVIGGTVQGNNYVGGVAGLSSGYIADCSSSASVSGASYIGGFVGGSYTMAALGGISDCYARGNVSGSSYVGGFMGDSSDTTIVNCYSTGAVSGTSNVGGFSGYNVNEYLTGSINVTGCFWDVTTSGRATSAAGTGLETTAMQDMNTYLNTSWDFADEFDNGGSNDWAMPAGGGYPVLWYELPAPPVLPSFAGGSGSAENPYLIETVEQLNSIGHNARLMDKHFRLVSDLDLNGLKYYMIAERPHLFTGTFDGAGHTISNILIEPVFNLSSVGFIGTLEGSAASVQNLTLIDPNVVADWGRGVGSLVGINQSGAVTNCHAVNTNVWGLMAVGGLVGNNYSYASISDCSATGHVSENTFMSIIFGAVGGLVGENSFYSEIKNSYAKCDVSGDDCVGGLVGSNLISNTVTNCYAGGTVTGTSTYVGGAVGRNLGSTQIEYCYSSVVVTGPTGNSAVGGFIGKMGTSGSERYTACFWNSEINGTLPGIGNGTDANVVGKTTGQMCEASAYLNAGWDFEGETVNGTADIWTICEGTNYPRHLWSIPTADFACPDGVEIYDLAVLSDQWLVEEIPADLAPPTGDGIVNFADFAVFASQWGDSKDIYALNDFAEQWLKVGLRRCSADISPLPDGDGVVNMLDFAMFAENWLTRI